MVGGQRNCIQLAAVLCITHSMIYPKGYCINRDWSVKWASNHQKDPAPAEDELLAAAQEVQPASGAADPVLYCNHPDCSLHIHHCLIWIEHQTGQEET